MKIKEEIETILTDDHEYEDSDAHGICQYCGKWMDEHYIPKINDLISLFKKLCEEIIGEGDEPMWNQTNAQKWFDGDLDGATDCNPRNLLRKEQRSKLKQLFEEEE